MHPRITRTLALACTLLAIGACSTKTETPPPPTVTTATASSATGGGRAEEVTLTATVEKIDIAERLVTLRGPGGETETIRVSENARNLAQVNAATRSW